MGLSHSIPKINFEIVQNMICDDTIIINTMPNNLQHCLIYNTVPASDEAKCINSYINNDLSKKILIYGINSIDDTVIFKYNQLKKLGFKNVYIYSGGMFEWLLLQDIYGDELFKTTTKELDILKYKNVTKQLLLTDK